MKKARVFAGCLAAFVALQLVGCASQQQIAGAEYGIIDVHVHFHYRAPGDLDKLAAWMDEVGVGRCINLPLRGSLPRNDQEYQNMLDNYAQYRGRIDRYTIIYPEEVQTVDEAVAILQREIGAGAIGFGEHYGLRDEYFDHPANMRLFEACERVGLPVLFHIDRGQNLDDQDLSHLENALRAYPDLVFIAHSDWWRRIDSGACGRLLSEYPNLYADISCTVRRSRIGSDPDFARAFFTEHADKLLFGSDAGWWTLSDRYDTPPEFEFIFEIGLPEDALAKILHGNAMRLFPLQEAAQPDSTP